MHRHTASHDVESAKGGPAPAPASHRLVSHAAPESSGRGHSSSGAGAGLRRLASSTAHGAKELAGAGATVLSCVLWIGASSWAILINKHLISGLGFGYPGAIAALGMVSTSVASWTCCRAMRLPLFPPAVSLRAYLYALIPTSLCMAFTFAAGNTAYLYLSVSFVQMLKAFTPVSTMLFAFAFRLERPTLRLVLAVGAITAGVAVASYGEVNFSLFGFVAMMSSVLGEGLRLVLTQRLMAHLHLHPMEALSHLAPPTAAWLLLLVATAGEGRAMAAAGAPALIVARHPLPFLMSACSGFALNALATVVIRLAGALALKVLGICKDVGLVLVGTANLHERVTPVQLVGYAVSLAGVALYNHLKLKEGRGPPSWTGKEGHRKPPPRRVPAAAATDADRV